MLCELIYTLVPNVGIFFLLWWRPSAVAGSDTKSSFSSQRLDVLWEEWWSLKISWRERGTKTGKTLLVTFGAVIVDSGFSGGKESAWWCRRWKWCGFNPWIGKIPWRREWLPTPVFLLGKSHGQRSLMGYSPWGCKELDMTERLSTHTHHWSGLLWKVGELGMEQKAGQIVRELPISTHCLKPNVPPSSGKMDSHHTAQFKCHLL